MNYVAYQLTDLGYATMDGTPLPDIWGLDNRVEDDIDLRFQHLGYDGYPEGARCCIDAPDKTRTLAVIADEVTPPDGGTEVAAADVPALLMAEFGWPEGTTLDGDGMPVAPEPEL